MHFKLRIVLFICALVAFLLLLSPASVNFDPREPIPAVLSECVCNLSSREPMEKHALLAPVLGTSGTVCVDKFAPVLFYPLPIPDLRDFVHRLMNGEGVGVEGINEHYSSISFPNVPLYFDRQPKGLLILIKSSAGSVDNRNVYRSTWAHPKYLSKFDVPIAHAFLIGIGQYLGTIPAALSAESNGNRDMIFQDFVDTYRNITHKTMGGLKWALESGPEFEFLVTLDDDLYFSVDQAVSLLKSPAAFNVSVDGSEILSSRSKFGFQLDSGESFLAGHKLGGQNNNFPSRDPRNKKLYTSWEEYPLERYPFYPAGGTIFFARQTVREMYTASPFVKHLEIEDAYIGIIASKLGIPLTDITVHITNANDFEPNPSANHSQLISWHIPGDLLEVRRVMWLQIHGNA